MSTSADGERKRVKPHLLRANVTDENGLVTQKTLRADQLRQPQGPLSVLTYEQKRRAKALWQSFGRYTGYPSQTQFVETFRFEQDPDREIGAYELMARLFGRYCAARPNADERVRRQAVAVFLHLSMGTVDIAAVTGVPQELVDDIKGNFGPEILIPDIITALKENHGVDEDDAMELLNRHGADALRLDLFAGKDPAEIAASLVRDSK